MEADWKKSSPKKSQDTGLKCQGSFSTITKQDLPNYFFNPWKEKKN